MAPDSPPASDSAARPLGVAVVGAGYWGPNLVRVVREVTGARLLRICDSDPRRLERIRGLHPDIATSQDLGEVLADSGIEAVVLATPVETHAPLGLRILEAGRHLLVEKPLATTVRDADALIAAAAARDVVLMVGHLFEYNAAVRKVRELIAAGELGALHYLHSERVNLGQVQTRSSALWTLAPHDVSIANLLLGEPPAWVQARGFRFLGQPYEDVVFLVVGYPGNRAAQIHASWIHPRKIRRTTVVGDRRMLVYDEMSTDHKVVVYDKGVHRVAVPEGEIAPPFGEFQFLTRSGDAWMPRIDFAEPLRVEVEHFVGCVATGSEPLTGGANGRAVVRVLEAAQRSLEEDSRTIAL